MRNWLQQLTATWRKRIEDAEKAKEEQFGRSAEEMWRYLTASYDDLYVVGGPAGDVAVYSAGPYYKPRINKFQEFVDLYMPFVLAQTPHRRVTVRRPQFSEDILRGAEQATISYAAIDKSVRVVLDTAALLLEWWLNYCADEYRLLKEARLAVTEALIKGRGVLWHGLVQTASGLIPASFYDSVDNLLIDPTAVTLRDAGFIVRKRRIASWLAADMFGIDERRIIEMAGAGRNPELDIDIGMVEFYEVFSRIGSGVALTSTDDELREWKDALEALGPYQYYAIAKSGDHPLNVDPEKIHTSEDLSRATEWPVQTYGDMLNPWPASFLDFYPNTGNPWARSPVEPGLPMQVFLDHLYAYVMSQARRATKTVIVVPDHVDTRFLTALRDQDTDYEVVPLNRQQVNDIAKELYHIIRFPEAPREIWEIISLCEMRFNRAVGLDDILYGAQPDKQIRSAAEAQIRFNQASNRAQAMAETVEHWMSMVASKDGILTRLHVPYTQMATFFMEPLVQGPDGTPMPGGPLTSIWSQAVTSNDPIEAGADFWFQIATGSAVRKDKAHQMQMSQFIAQTLLPVAMEVSSKTGDFTMFNRILERLTNALDVDLSLFRIEQNQMMAMPGGGTQNGRHRLSGGTPQESQQPPQGGEPIVG